VKARLDVMADRGDREAMYWRRAVGGRIIEEELVDRLIRRS